MSMSGVFARVVALVGGGAVVVRRVTQGAHKPAWGTAPDIPIAKPQGNIPTLKMPTAQGWADGQTPVAAPGLAVNAFARDLDHPRWITVLPNGDVLVAEATNADRAARSVFDYAMVSTMKRAAAMGGERQPHHAAARPGRRWRGRDPTALHGRPEPAVRHGFAGRQILCGEYRRHRRVSLCRGGRPHHRAGPEVDRFQTRRPLDPQPAPESGRPAAFCRCRFADQYRR